MTVPVVVALMVALIAFIAVIFGVEHKTPCSLDLKSVRDAMISRHGWDKSRADSAEMEYVRFLVLLQMEPKFPVIPWADSAGRDDLDQFWHQHILDTVKYANDCRAVFGKIIHHNPHITKGSPTHQEAAQRTSRLYARKFKTGASGSAMDTSTCSACAAVVDASSHSHSGSHDGGSHGGGHDGGHSCGGHSCGGHGCGGGH